MIADHLAAASWYCTVSRLRGLGEAVGGAMSHAAGRLTSQSQEVRLEEASWKTGGMWLSLLDKQDVVESFPARTL